MSQASPGSHRHCGRSQGATWPGKCVKQEPVTHKIFQVNNYVLCYTVYKEFRVKYAVKCGFGGAHGITCCRNMGARGGIPYHRARLGLVPTIHTVDGPVMSKLKQGTATVSWFLV